MLARLETVSVLVSTFLIHCCFTSTETMRFTRDGEPRTATSTFRQLLNSQYISLIVCL